jgi:hypothetical protein
LRGAEESTELSKVIAFLDDAIDAIAFRFAEQTTQAEAIPTQEAEGVLRLAASITSSDEALFSVGRFPFLEVSPNRPRRTLE